MAELWPVFTGVNSYGTMSSVENFQKSKQKIEKPVFLLKSLSLPRENGLTTGQLLISLKTFFSRPDRIMQGKSQEETCVIM
jgi:hypothetical protein